MTGAWRRRVLGGLSVLLLGTGAALGGATVAGAAARSGDVYVVNGIAGTALDVEIDGQRVRSDLPAGSILGPLSLPRGRHVVSLSDSSSGSATPVTEARFTVKTRRSIDVVAHRAADAAGTPRVTVFANDLEPVAPGKSRLVVSHAAVAPPADIRIDGKPFFRNVANGESLSVVVPAKSYRVDVVPSSGGERILGPVRLAAKAGTLTRVFAVGNAMKAEAVVQVLSVPVVGTDRPRAVPTGDGGQAADLFVGQGPSSGIYALLAVGFGVITLVAARRRSPAAPARSRHAR